MYLMCPRCRSCFGMDASALDKRGRKVRCSVCAKTWRARQQDLLDQLPQKEGAQKVTEGVTQEATEAFTKATQAAVPLPSSAGSRANAPPPSASSPLASPLSSPYAPDIPSPQSAETEGAAARLEALTQHHHAFAPLHFAERSIEQPLNNLLRFAFAWMVWGAFLLGLFYAVRTYPLDILNRFPNAIHIYERLNMSHPDFAKLLLNGKDYSLTQVEVVSEYRLSRDLLVVRALVGNRTNEERPVPILRGTFFDARGEETGYFHFEPQEETLPAQGALEYNAQVDLPLPTSTTLTLTLLSFFEGRLDLGGSRLKVHNTKKRDKEKTSDKEKP